jgi:membrane protease YdiL (CAAX protease family)
LASTGAIVAFFVLAYAISWGWSFTLVANGDIVRRGVGWPTASPALAGPLIAAVVVTAWMSGRVGLADLARRIVRWRFAPRWWAATLSPLAFLGIGLGVAALTGHYPKASDLGRYNGWPLIGIGGAALAALLGGFAEETGWRGFALPAFQRRVGAARAALIVAAFWGLWHLPYFFLVSSYRGFGPFTLVGFTIGILSGSVVLTWLYYGAGQSILAVAVWHAAYDMATSGTSGTIQAIVSALVIAQAIVLWRLHDRSLKHGSRPVLGPPADERPT